MAAGDSRLPRGGGGLNPGREVNRMFVAVLLKLLAVIAVAMGRAGW